MNKYFSKKINKKLTAHVKMLNIINYRGNANQNYNKTALYTQQYDFKAMASDVEMCGKMGNLVCCQGKYEMVQPLWKTVQ